MTSFDPRTVNTFQAQQFGTPRTGQFGAQGFAGQQFPGPVPPPPSRPSRTKRPLAAKLVAGFIAAGVVVGGAGTWIAVSGSNAEAAIQTTSFAGANPTTNPFGTDAPQVAAVAATGPQSGSTPGLYAATTPPACDTADFLAQLQTDPNKLAAFGGVFGVNPADVPAFISTLSPVVLRAATSVTDHPFADGAFTEQPAVLAPGTAVLVDGHGAPTVKCFNGNPLTAGPEAPNAVTVTPTTEVVAQFSFTTVDNSRVVVVTPPKPDPEALKKAAEAAQKKADQSRTDADAARKDADAARLNADLLTADAKIAGKASADADSKLSDANDAVAKAQIALTNAKNATPPFPTWYLNSLQFDLDKAHFAQGAAKADADNAKAKLLAADQKVADANKAADEAEQKAKDLAAQAQKDADAAAQAKQAAGTKDDADHQSKDKGKEVPADQITKVDDPTVAAKNTTPGPATQACPAVVTDATATAQCPAPTGKADTATKEDTTSTTTTDSDAKKDSTTSSGDTSSAKSGSDAKKEGSDK
jgi:hypothetical protein